MRVPLMIALAAAPLLAENVLTDPLGFNKVVCLTNSDTIVGVPFRQQGSLSALTAGAPGEVTGEPDLAEISLQALTLDAGSLNRHYLKFDGGTRDGRWYDITANSTSSVTIHLNGDDLAGVVEGDRVVIAEYWTLDSLFPPGQATTSWTEDPENPGQWVQDGHAIVASLGTLAFQRRTLVLLPDIEGGGINRSASGLAFIHDNQWQSVADSIPNPGGMVLYPDSVFTIRHNASVSHPTIFRSMGEVEVANFAIPLHTDSTGRRDTFIGLPRPIDLTLSELNLWESGAFVASLGNLAFQRRDILLVFDNSQFAINKSASELYFHNGTSWLAVGDSGATNRDGDVIPAGAGFIIRKHQTDTGGTVFWNNPPSF